MKKLAMIACAVLQLSCGSAFLDQTVYREITYEPDGIEIKEEVVDFTQTVKDSSYQLRYCYSSDNQQTCYQYSLVDTQASKEQVYVNTSGNNERLWFADFKEYTLNGEEYKVYKYFMDIVTTDGRSEHFWCPQFGIIIIKSSTWKNFEQLVNLQGNNQQSTIQALCEVIYNDQPFYSGRNEVELDSDSISSDVIDQISNSLDGDP